MGHILGVLSSMSSNTISFNLTQQPWISVVSQTWQQTEISLIHLFEAGAQFRAIQAENPPTTLALYRFLVALMHHVYQGPEDEADWEDIQADQGKKVVAYLKANNHYFDLLAPERPFMQDPTLTLEMGAEIYQAHVLHGNNTSTVFCHEHEWSGTSLGLATAARLVLRLHTFDVMGKKAGSSESAKSIPLMDAANVIVQGENLRETLFLNLMQYNAKDIPSAVNGQDLPAWERDPQPASERIPAGYIDYLTFQWRRVRLFTENERAIKVAFHAGDRLPKDISATIWECGIAYIKNPKGLFTVRLDLNRSLWRDATAFLQSSDDNACPRLIGGWLAELKAEGLIEQYLKLQILGLRVDNAKPLSWTSENFSAPVAYIKNKPLWQALVKALKLAEDHQHIFRSFKGSPYHALAEALNHPEAGNFAKSLDGESRYWAMLDQNFPDLLKDLPNERISDLNGVRYGDQALTKWQETLQQAARQAFIESILGIRNYEARAKALRTLEWKLKDLRSSPEEKAARKVKAKKSSPKTAKASQTKATDQI
jgi:CRISPR system Cascade subunit CasA